MLTVYCSFYKKSDGYIIGQLPMLDICEADKDKVQEFAIDSLSVELYGGYLYSYDFMRKYPYLSDYEIYYTDLEYLFLTAAYPLYDNPKSSSSCLLFDPKLVLESINKLITVIGIMKDQENAKELQADLDRYDEEIQLNLLKKNLELAIEQDFLFNYELC